MFRRSTKLTALLVAAASVASMTPVMAVEKLNQKDGTVKNAVAYDDGKYAYYGYKNDDDDTGIWYNAGSSDKDKMIEDLEEYEIKEKYGTKYAYVTEDGNKDEYLVDLSSGKVADDESAEDKENDARGKLVSALKKSERYNKLSDSQYDIDDNGIATHRLFKNQFGDVWYQYVTTNNGAGFTGDNENYYDQVSVTTGVNVDYLGGDEDSDKTAYTGFFNEKGKYVDVSYAGDLKIYSARKNKAVKIEKYGKVYQDEALRVNLVSVQALAQDKDYIYTLTTVDVDYFVNTSGKAGSYTYNFKDTAVKGTDYKTVTQQFIQKISKAQGDKEDGAYLPKSIDSYQVADTNLWDDGDVEDAKKAMFDADADKMLYAVNGKYLYAVRIDDASSNVKVTKMEMGKGKYNFNNSSLINDLKELKADGDDIDISVLKKSEDDDMDVELGINSVSIDVDGKIWAINEGKIKMFDDSEFKDQYSTDRSYNRLDVYNKDSLIAWDDDDDSYTTVQEGKAQTVSDAEVIDPTLTSGGNTATTAKTGWEQQADGTWVLYDAVGNKVTGWANVSGVWYYMDATGIMKTGWINDNGTWYYCNASGAMQTGWLNDNGTWYYLQSNGAMKTGWLNDNGTWYYLKSSGAMAANETIDGYYLNASGAWVK